MDSAIRQKVIEKMTTERDLKNQMDWARKEAIEEGLAEGRAEGINETRLEIAKRMLNKGMPEEEVADLTALTLEELRSL